MSNLSLLKTNANNYKNDIINAIEKNQTITTNLTLNGDTRISNLEEQDSVDKLFTLDSNLMLKFIDYTVAKIPVTISPTLNCSTASPFIYELYCQRFGNMVQCWGTLNEMTINSSNAVFNLSFPIPGGTVSNGAQVGGTLIGDEGFGLATISEYPTQVIECIYRTSNTFTSKIFVNFSYSLFLI